MAKAVISNVVDYKTVDIYTSNYATSKITYRKPFTSIIEDTLPFRVKFMSIGVPGYSPTNVPPIGIAIIGVNNYIL